MAPTEADRSNDLEDGWDGEAVASGKLFMIKLTIALTVGGTEVSSASFSSREGEEGWLGEDLNGVSLEKALKTKLEMSDGDEERLSPSTHSVII